MTTTPAGLAEERIAADEAAVVDRFVTFLKTATDARAAGGVRRRFNQTRATACVDAEFIVPGDLPADLRVGLFGEPGTRRASIRFANASSSTDRDRDIRGMSIRVFDAGGENLTPGSTVQDFVLNSHPVMMAPDTRGFMELLEANEAGGFRRVLYFLSHPAALRIGMAARTNPSCHLDLSYWSTTPFLFGPGRAVKYIAVPHSAGAPAKPATLTDTYLTDAMRTRLAGGDATFDVMVQFQTDARRMPIEDASVEWKREDSPYRRVASVRIPSQPLDGPGRTEACEAIAFNPWHARTEHRPLGSMNRARRAIYEAMAQYRNAEVGA